MELSSGQLWQHCKGGMYHIIALAQNNETDELYDVVVYEDTTDSTKIWTQSKARFLETIEREGKQMPRFVKTSN